MEVHSSETLVKFYHITWHHIPQDSTLQTLESVQYQSILKKKKRHEMNSQQTEVVNIYHKNSYIILSVIGCLEICI